MDIHFLAVRKLDAGIQVKDKSYLQALLGRTLHAPETVAMFCCLLWKTDIHFNRFQTSRLQSLSVDFDPFFVFLASKEHLVILCLFVSILVMIDENENTLSSFVLQSSHVVKRLV